MTNKSSGNKSKLFNVIVNAQRETRTHKNLFYIFYSIFYDYLSCFHRIKISIIVKKLFKFYVYPEVVMHHLLYLIKNDIKYNFI